MSVDALHARWSRDEGQHEHVVFAVEGMRCAGCARSIERAVHALPGVERVNVNAATARVSVDSFSKASVETSSCCNAFLSASISFDVVASAASARLDAAASSSASSIRSRTFSSTEPRSLCAVAISCCIA